MGYWTYYLAWFAIAYFTRYPWLVLGVPLFFLLRRFVPDPVLWLRTAGRMRALRGQIQANSANVTARRDLARLYLDRRRPRAALVLLDEARKRAPDDAELLYYTGLARLRAGDAAGALEPLVRSVEIDSRVLFGEAYLVAGDALRKIGRYPEAEDAYDRYVVGNTSSMEGLVKLALMREKQGNADGARGALREASDTWAQLPSFRRRKELAWWFRAHVARWVG